MPASRSRRTTGAVALLGVVTVLGVSCTASHEDAADGQSVTAACAALADAVDGAMTTFAGTDAADAAATAEATASVRDELIAAARAIDNARVEAIAGELTAGFDVLAEATAAAAAGDIAGATDLADATDRIRTGVAEYHDLCTG